MSEFEIRIANEEDRERVIGLMSGFYPGDMAARYDWLYRSNPHGRALTWLALDRSTNEAVACTSVFPRKVIVAGRERTGSIGGDCYVLPSARRRGLATALHRASFVGMRERSVDFMYGPPVPNNLAALVKAGSQVVTGYRRWVRPLSARAAKRDHPSSSSRSGTTLAKLEARLAYLPVMVLEKLTGAYGSEYALEPVTEFGPEFDSMFDRAAATHDIACVRDRSYLNWRYFANPIRRQTPLALTRAGVLVGFIALEVADSHAAIADIFSAADPELIDAAILMAAKYATAAGCSSLEISLVERAAVARRLRRLGFIGREERGFQVAVDESDPQSHVLLDPRSWHFTEADQDMCTVFSYETKAEEVYCARGKTKVFPKRNAYLECADHGGALVASEVRQKLKLTAG